MVRIVVISGTVIATMIAGWAFVPAVVGGKWRIIQKPDGVGGSEQNVQADRVMCCRVNKPQTQAPPQFPQVGDCTEQGGQSGERVWVVAVDGGRSYCRPVYRPAVGDSAGNDACPSCQPDNPSVLAGEEKRFLVSETKERNYGSGPGFNVPRTQTLMGRLDHNGDGNLDAEELAKARAVLESVGTQGEVRNVDERRAVEPNGDHRGKGRLWERLDFNRDGKLDYRERENAMIQIRRFRGNVR